MSEPIPFDELPARIRLAANELRAVGAAMQYYYGFNAISGCGVILESRTAPQLVELARNLEQMCGGSA